jgi:hypothetical protein
MTIKSTREHLSRILEGMPAEALEDVARYAEFVRYKLKNATPQSPKRGKRKKHPAAGIWADRAEITDSAAYSLTLRHKIETRQDGTLPH